MVCFVISWVGLVPKSVQTCTNENNVCYQIPGFIYIISFPHLSNTKRKKKKMFFCAKNCAVIFIRHQYTSTLVIWKVSRCWTQQNYYSLFFWGFSSLGYVWKKNAHRLKNNALIYHLMANILVRKSLERKSEDDLGTFLFFFFFF